MTERLSAMVGLRGPAKLKKNELAKELRRYLAKADGEAVFAEHQNAEGSGMVVSVGSFVIAILALPFRIPVETVAPMLQQEIVWKDAADTYTKTNSHYFISVLGSEADPRSRYDQARILTAVAAACVSVGKASIVFWDAAERAMPPEQLLQAAKELSREGPSQMAHPAWFAFRFAPGSPDPNSDLLICQTRGLAVFQGREIECGPYAMAPADMWQRVLTCACYMAAAGPVFADGQTLSISGDPQPDARIHLDWSATGGENRPIFQLRLFDQEGDA